MARTVVREMKNALRVGAEERASPEARLQAQQAALALLARSVRMRHRRLAVHRLSAAVSMGLPVPDEYWRHCRHAAEESKNRQVQEMFLASARLALHA